MSYLIGACALGPRLVRLAFDEMPAQKLHCVFRRQTIPSVGLHVVAREDSGSQQLLVTNAVMTPGARYLVAVHSGDQAFGSAPFDGFRSPGPSHLDLWNLLPKHNRNADSGDLRLFVSCLQDIVDNVLAVVDTFPDSLDPATAGESHLKQILEDLGNPFSFPLNLSGMRRLAGLLPHLYHQKGTDTGLRNALRFFLGLEARIQPQASATLELGADNGPGLGSTRRDTLYAFDIHLDQKMTEDEACHVRSIVDFMKPARTTLGHLKVPEPPPFVPWEVGEHSLDAMDQSNVGLG